MGGSTKAEGIWIGAGMTGVYGMVEGVAYEEGGNGFLGRMGDTFLLAGFSLGGSGCFGRFASGVMITWILARHFCAGVCFFAMGVVRGMESPGTKLITRMPIFDRASTLIYYTRGLC